MKLSTKNIVYIFTITFVIITAGIIIYKLIESNKPPLYDIGYQKNYTFDTYPADTTPRIFFKDQELIANSGKSAITSLWINNKLYKNETCFYVEFVCVNSSGKAACPGNSSSGYRWNLFFGSELPIKLKRMEYDTVDTMFMATGPSEQYVGRIYVWSFFTQDICPNVNSSDYNVDPATGRAGDGELASQLKFYASEDFTVEVR